MIIFGIIYSELKFYCEPNDGDSSIKNSANIGWFMLMAMSVMMLF